MWTNLIRCITLRYRFIEFGVKPNFTVLGYRNRKLHKKVIKCGYKLDKSPHLMVNLTTFT